MDWEPRVGMRVVCVKDSNGCIIDLGYPPFKKGEVYTISDLSVAEPYGLFLHFIELPWANNGHVSGFRPLDERRLDIFRAILTKAPTPEKEPA